MGELGQGEEIEDEQQRGGKLTITGRVLKAFPSGDFYTCSKMGVELSAERRIRFLGQTFGKKNGNKLKTLKITEDTEILGF